MGKAKIMLPALALLAPVFCYADISISEIMYAPQEGVAHEWFEVFNSGEDTINLEKWKCNDGSNHSFEKPPENGGQGSLVLASGDYAVIAKEADTFLAAHPGFSGTVIDASFSLADAGDTLSLINDEGVTVHTVAYGEDAGAQKNGLSIHYNGSSWIAAQPSPGSSLGQPGQPQQQQQAVSGQTVMESETVTPVVGVAAGADVGIRAFAGSDRTVAVGADAIFDGQAYGRTGEPLTQARYVWSFGDGGSREGKAVTYRYAYPGTYVVFLTISSGMVTASDRIDVTASPASVVISSVTPDLIALRNDSSFDLDLTSWFLESGTVFFAMPRNTVIASHTEVLFPNHVTGLTTGQGSPVTLFYPNGQVATDYAVKVPKAALARATGNDLAKAAVIRTLDITTSESEIAAENKGIEGSNTEGLPAAAGMAGSGDEALYTWLVALTVLIGVAVAAAVVLRRSDTGGDGITIIE